MNARLSRARRATPEYLLEFLSEQDVKYVCERLSISATGRRTTLVSMLLVSAGRSPATERTATAQTEAPEASFGRIAPQSGGAVRGRDSEERPSNTLYTVGCNGIPEPKEMAELLRKHGVEVLVDVRERPFQFQVSVQQEEAGRHPRADEVGRAGLSSYRRVGQRGQAHRGSSTQERSKGSGAVVGRNEAQSRRHHVSMQRSGEMPQKPCGREDGRADARSAHRAPSSTIAGLSSGRCTTGSSDQPKAPFTAFTTTSPDLGTRLAGRAWSPDRRRNLLGQHRRVLCALRSRSHPYRRRDMPPPVGACVRGVE